MANRDGDAGLGLTVSLAVAVPFGRVGNPVRHGPGRPERPRGHRGIVRDRDPLARIVAANRGCQTQQVVVRAVHPQRPLLRTQHPHTLLEDALCRFLQVEDRRQRLADGEKEPDFVPSLGQLPLAGRDSSGQLTGALERGTENLRDRIRIPLRLDLHFQRRPTGGHDAKAPPRGRRWTAGAGGKDGNQVAADCVPGPDLQPEARTEVLQHPSDALRQRRSGSGVAGHGAAGVPSRRTSVTELPSSL